jgi:hypothetical protein
VLHEPDEFDSQLRIEMRKTFPNAKRQVSFHLIERSRMRFQSLPLQYRRLLARAAAARRARRIAPSNGSSRPWSDSFDLEALSFFANLPLRARLANRFTDAMLAIDDALVMCQAERDESRDTSWIEPQIQTTYEQVNALMEAVCE